MLKKKCNKCLKSKDVSEFHKNSAKGDGLQTMCKSCRKKYHRKHYLSNRAMYIDNARVHRDEKWEWLQELKSKLVCCRCGEARWWVLDFHHVEGKSDNISNLIKKGMSKKIILKEIEKCEPVCANCHRDLHYQEKLQASNA